MQERTQKLLILVGEQGASFQSRDFKKIIESIVDNYISSKNEKYNQNLMILMRKVIQKVPLKQHIYAGITTQIRRVNPELATLIVEQGVIDFQSSMSNLQLHESINSLIYYAQLMNISVINSLSFMNLLEDLCIIMQNTKNTQYRAFFVQLITRTLPYYSYSLNQKVPHDFKKFMERVRKYCGSGKNALFAWIFDQYQKRNLTDNSLMHRLETKFMQAQQLQINFKMQLKIYQTIQFDPIDYLFLSPENDKDTNNKLYQQFLRTQGSLHQYNIQQVIQSFSTNQSFLMQKLTVYIKNYESSFFHRFILELLIAKSLKAKQSIIEPMIIVKLINAAITVSNDDDKQKIQQQNKPGQNLQNIVENILLQYFHKQAQINFDLNVLLRFTQIISLLVNNISKADKTWDWQKYIDPKQQQAYKKRKIILKIALQKISILNDRATLDPALSIYHPPQVLKTQTRYKTSQELENFEIFVDFIKNKADSEQIMSKFQNPQSDYEMFLEALFQKCSLSHTHLQILMSRYQGIFEKNKEEYDWTLITKIRSFWCKSLYHRLIYLIWVIEHGYCDFNSYVKYIGKLQAANQQQNLWVRLQLNQLNKKFGVKLGQSNK